MQAYSVEGEKNQIQYKRGIYSAKKSIDDEERIAGHTHNPQGNHCFHGACNDAGRYGRIAEPHGPLSMLEKLHTLSPPR
jgi:hypothetical protein